MLMLHGGEQGCMTACRKYWVYWGRGRGTWRGEGKLGQKRKKAKHNGKTGRELAVPPFSPLTNRCVVNRCERTFS